VFGVQWCILGGTWQSGQIKEFAKLGRGIAYLSLLFSSLPFSFSLTLRSRPLKTARESGGALYSKLLQWSPGRAPAENEFGAV